MKAQNRCCPLHQDTCDHCGFYDMGNNLCEYDESLSYERNEQSILGSKLAYHNEIWKKNRAMLVDKPTKQGVLTNIEEKTNGSTCKEV